MIENYNQIKQFLKNVSEYIKATRIRDEKFYEKLASKGINNNSLCVEISKIYQKDISYLYNPSNEYRLLHIALSLFRGKSIEQIEKPKENKKLQPWQWEKINSILQNLKKEVELYEQQKALRSCAQ